MSMKNINLLQKPIINIFLFFFIVLSFLGQIHLQINSNFKYEKIQNSNEYSIIKDKQTLKKKFSESLTSDETYEALNRKCEYKRVYGDRHKVRWVKNLFLKNFFLFSEELNEKLPYYTNIFLHSILIFLSLILLRKTFFIDDKYIFLFLLYLSFVFQNYLGEYSYSIFEMFFLCLSIYASKNKKFLLFITSVLLAVLNRESGFIILLSWLIFNKDYKTLFIGASFVGIIFVILNLDIARCLINPKFFIPFENEPGQINIHNLSEIGFLSFVKVMFINFLLPFGLFFYYFFITKNKNRVLLYMILIYLITFIFAAPLHHISIRLLILPLIFTSIYLYQKENQKI